mgnify:FL=1
MTEDPGPIAGTTFEDRLVRLLDLTLGIVLAVLVFAMMVLTFLDVLGRQGFNAPVPAAFELTELMMGFTVYLGLPVVSARREHLTIGLLDYLFTGNVRRVQGVVLNLLLGVLCLLWAREVWIQGDALVAQNELLMFLQVQIAPFVYAMALLTFVAALIFLVLAVRAIWAPPPVMRLDQG